MCAINVDPWGVLTKQATNIMKTPGKCFKCVCRRHHFLCSASSRILACFPVQERPLPGSLSVCPLLLMSLNGSFWRCDFPFLHRQTSGISRCRGGAMHQGLNGLIWPHLHLWHCGALWTHREMLTRSLPGLWQTPWGETSVLFHRFFVVVFFYRPPSKQMFLCACRCCWMRTQRTTTYWGVPNERSCCFASSSTFASEERWISTKTQSSLISTSPRKCTKSSSGTNGARQFFIFCPKWKHLFPG